MCRLPLWAVLLAFPLNWAVGQTLTRRPKPIVTPSTTPIVSQPARSVILLTVPAGTPLKVALDQEVRANHMRDGLPDRPLWRHGRAGASSEFDHKDREESEPRLVGQLTKQLSITPNQAMGGAGALFGLA